mgnify:CR=1 FL=1
MKKNYFLTLVLTLLLTSIYGQDLLITGIIDGPLPGGLPKGIELYVVNDIADMSIYGVESTTNGTAAAGVEFTFPADTYTAGTYVYVATESAGFNQYLGVTPQYEDNVVGINGDDTVILYKNGAIEDSIGRIGEDGTGKDWDHKDGWAYRKDGKGPNATFDATEWTFSGADALDGCDKSDDSGTNGECSSVFPVGTYKSVASTTPELSITSPTDASTISFTDMATVKFSVDNFTIAAGGAGDGFIKWKLNGVDQADKFNTDDITFTSTGGTMYTVYIELVDNSGNVLATPINDTVTFTVGFPCDLQLETITKTCSTETAGVDMYSVSITFTGGNTSTYVLASDQGTVGGDDPSSMATGTITITNINEGTDIVFTAKGDVSNSSCDLSRNISSPVCKALPFIETFDYTDGAILSDQVDWDITSTSSDDIVVSSGNLEYTGLKASTGNKITFDGVGSDVVTRFTDVSSGKIYASFLFKVSAFQTGTNPDTTDGGYFALFVNNNSFQTRIWVRPNPDTSGTTYDIGFGKESENPPFSTTTYNIDDVLFIVTEYDMDSKTVSLWVNPGTATFEAAAPTPDLGNNDSNPPSAINGFVLRQDSANETPSIEIDELRIGRTWAEVTPKEATASVKENEIEGFAVYPNPVSGKTFTLTTSSFDKKEVSVFSILGKEVLKTKVSGTNNTVNIAGLNSGLYIVKVVEAGKTATSKLIIK